MNLHIIRSNPLFIPVLIAESKGLFKKHNVLMNLTIQEDFTFNGENPFLTGESHGMMGDTTFFFYMLEKGIDAVITSNLTRTIQVVGRKEALNKNKVIAGVNRAGIFRLLLENDLRYLKDKVEIKWINNTFDRIEAYRKGEVDIIVAIDPFIPKFLEIGGEVLWSLKDSDKNLVMWAFHKNYLLKNTLEVKNFYKALNEAQDYFNSLTQSDKIKVMLDNCGYSIDSATTYKNFNFEKYTSYSKKDFNLCQNWMKEAKEIKNKYSDDLAIDLLNENI